LAFKFEGKKLKFKEVHRLNDGYVTNGRILIFLNISNRNAHQML